MLGRRTSRADRVERLDRRAAGKLNSLRVTGVALCDPSHLPAVCRVHARVRLLPLGSIDK